MVLTKYILKQVWQSTWWRRCRALFVRKQGRGRPDRKLVVAVIAIVGRIEDIWRQAGTRRGLIVDPVAQGWGVGLEVQRGGLVLLL